MRIISLPKGGGVSIGRFGVPVGAGGICTCGVEVGEGVSTGTFDVPIGAG
jgi:hypothetical protein